MLSELSNVFLAMSAQTCAASAYLAQNKMADTVKAGLLLSGGATRIVGELLALELLDSFIPGGSESANFVIAVAQALSNLPTGMNLAESILSQDSLPPLPKTNMQRLREEHEEAQEQRFTQYSKELKNLETEQEQMLTKAVLGHRQAKTGPITPIDLKNIGVGLRNLSMEHKRELVKAFARASDQFDPTINTSASASYLKAHLSPSPPESKTSQLGLFDKFKRTFIPSAKRESARLELLGQDDFPNKIKQELLVQSDPALLSLCDKSKLQKEKQRISEKLRAQNSGQIFSHTKQEEIRQEVEELNARLELNSEPGTADLYKYETVLKQREEQAILSEVNIAAVLSEDAYKQARDLKKERENPSKTSFAALESSSYLDRIKEFVTRNKVSRRHLQLLAHKDFPNFSQDMLIRLDKTLIDLCDIPELYRQIAIAEAKIREEKDGVLLTTEEIESLRQEVETANKQSNLPSDFVSSDFDALLQQRKRELVLSRIPIAAIISKESYTHARRLKAMAENKVDRDSDEDVNEQFEQIIKFLHTDPCNSGDLIKSLSQEIKGLSPSLQQALIDCYNHSRHSLLETLAKEAQKPTLKRGEAIKFYENHLTTANQRQLLMEDFTRGLTEQNYHSKFNMAQIATYLGLLDPETDKKEIEAYSAMLFEMGKALREAVIQTANHSELAKKFESSLELLDDMSRASFARRGERLEKNQEMIQTLASGLDRTGTALMVGGTLVTPAAPYLYPISSGLKTLAAGLRLTEETYDTKQVEAVSRPRSSQSEAQQRYQEAKMKVEAALKEINACLITSRTQLAKAKLFDTSSAMEISICNDLYKNIQEKIKFITQYQRDLEALGELEIGEQDPPELALKKSHDYIEKLKHMENHFAQAIEKLNSTAKGLEHELKILDQKPPAENPYLTY